MENRKEPAYSIVPSERNCALINEVRKFPALYDTSYPDYYVLAERNKAWLKVAENCNVPAEQCHLRWKSLRKRYAKERRRFKEILNGQRKPWALFPKMSFLANSVLRGRIKTFGRRRRVAQKKITPPTTEVENSQSAPSEDDMLILDDNNEIVRTCKAGEMPEEDGYIYEHLDDPDSALQILNENPAPSVKQTAIRTGAPTTTLPIPSRIGGSGRIRKLTPKMQNSIIAKKLKQAQQILQQSSASMSYENTIKANVTNGNVIYSNANKNTPIPNINKARHVATVNPNVVRFGKSTHKEANKNPQQQNVNISTNSNNNPTNSTESNQNKEKPANTHENLVEVKKEPGTGDKHWALKVVKLKGRNPIIFSPEDLPKYQSFLKGDAKSPIKENLNEKPTSPVIKVKSVENLNSNSSSPIVSNNEYSDNLDIIHSVGLVRKQSLLTSSCSERVSHQAYSRAYSWNRPDVKTIKKTTTQEKTQPDSQTKDYEIEETWNDIKQEYIDEYEPSQFGDNQEFQGSISQALPESPPRNMWNKLSEAKLDLVLHQKKLLDEQHKKNLEYMKKEHELKMILLRAEIDLKRKQLNIML